MFHGKHIYYVHVNGLTLSPVFYYRRKNLNIIAVFPLYCERPITPNVLLVPKSKEHIHQRLFSIDVLKDALISTA